MGKGKADGGHSRIFPRSVSVSIGDRSVEIVPISLDDMSGWSDVIADALSDLEGKDTLSQAEFIKLVMAPGRLKNALRFIVCRPRPDESGKTVFVNEMTDLEIGAMTPVEALSVVEALFQVADVGELLGKITGLWERVEEIFAPTPAVPPAQASRRN